MNIKYKCLLFSLFLFYCSTQDSWAGMKEIRDGVVYIKNTGTGIWGDSKKVKLKELLTIGSEEVDENYILARPFEIDVDNERNVYICDFIDNCIKVFDKNGKFIRIIGSKGGGPGELLGPSQIALSPNDEIYIFESGNRRFSFFNLEGTFLTSFNWVLNYSIGDFVCDPEGNIIVSVWSYVPYSQDKQYYIFDKKGNILSSFGFPVFTVYKDNHQQYSPSNLAYTQQNLLSAFLFPYRIEFIDNNHQLIKVVTHDCKLFNEPELIFKMGSLPFYQSRGNLEKLFAFPDGRFIVTIIDFGINFKQDIKKNVIERKTSNNTTIKYDLYNKEGRLLTTFIINPELGKICYIDNEGYIYTKSLPDQIPAIRKFKMYFYDKN